MLILALCLFFKSAPNLPATYIVREKEDTAGAEQETVVDSFVLCNRQVSLKNVESSLKSSAYADRFILPKQNLTSAIVLNNAEYYGNTGN